MLKLLTRLLPFAAEMLSSSDARRHRRITTAVHDEGGKILLQVLHAGRYAYHPLSVSASSIKAPINPFRPRMLRDVEGTISDFVRCSELAREAGYDGAMSIEHEDLARAPLEGVTQSVALLRRVITSAARSLGQ